MLKENRDERNESSGSGGRRRVSCLGGFDSKRASRLTDQSRCGSGGAAGYQAGNDHRSALALASSSPLAPLASPPLAPPSSSPLVVGAGQIAQGYLNRLEPCGPVFVWS